MTLRESYTEPLLECSAGGPATTCMFSGWPRYDTHRHMVSVLMTLQQTRSGRARCKRKAHQIRYRVDGPASSAMSYVPTPVVQHGQATSSEKIERAEEQPAEKAHDELASGSGGAREKAHDELASGSGGARENPNPRRQPAAPPGEGSAPSPDTRPSPAMH